MHILIVLHSKHEKISVWRTIHDFHVLRFIFKIIFKMKYFHRNYFFLLIASALPTVLWSLMYTTTRYRTRFSLMMAVDGTAETSGFVENIGLRPNIQRRNLKKNYFFVADNVVHIYIKNMHKINGLYKLMIDLH